MQMQMHEKQMPMLEKLKQMRMHGRHMPMQKHGKQKQRPVVQKPQ